VYSPRRQKQKALEYKLLQSGSPRFDPEKLEHWFKYLTDRVKQLRLFQTAASLASLSLLAMVPLLSLGLWVLSLSPSFGKLKTAFLRLFEQMLLPNVSAVVVRYVDQFSARSADLPIIGFLGFVITAYAAVNTIDKTFQLIFGVATQRSLPRKMLNYTLVLCMGPLLLATLYLLTIGFGTPFVEWALSGIADTRQEQRWVNSQLKWFWPLLIGFVALTGLYKLLPLVKVNVLHAMLGALFSLLAILLLKIVLAGYFSAFPTFKTVYGAIAVVPIFLLWLNALWLLLLLGALVVAQFSSDLQGSIVGSKKAHLSAEQMYVWSQALASSLYDNSVDSFKQLNDSDWRSLAQLNLIKSNSQADLIGLLTLLEQGGFIQIGKRPGAPFAVHQRPLQLSDDVLVRWCADQDIDCEARLRAYLWTHPLPTVH
jgi:YihY family inner membrane protein